MSCRSALVVLAVACGGAVGLAGCGTDAERSGAARTTKASTAYPERTTPTTDASAALSTSQLVGQRIVTGYSGPTLPRRLLRAVRRGAVGGVILFADNVPTLAAARRTATRLQRAARQGKQPYLLVMIDQEGGDVSRLSGAPPATSPAEMGVADRTGAAARKEGERTGRVLRGLGIDVDLAPVVDVPVAEDSFLGTRAFGRTVAVVARAGCSFAEGLGEAGVAATLKHFPGLGRATANTDEQQLTIDATRAQLDAELEAYRRCGRDVPLVMLSSAVYPVLDARAPAVLSPVAYAALADTGFRGLTISDAFDTPGIVSRDRPALRALRAGLDLLLYGQKEEGAQVAYARLVNDARAGRIGMRHLRAAARDILAFKARLARGMP